MKGNQQMTEANNTTQNPEYNNAQSKQTQQIKKASQLTTVDQAPSPAQDATNMVNAIPDKENITNISAKTSKVEVFIMELSKIGSVSFNQNKNTRLYSDSLTGLAMEKKESNKTITTLVALNFDEINMNKDGITITTSKELEPFDRIVHDAIITLYVEGGNEYITPTMIFNVITGDPNKRMHENFARAINDSINKMMYTSIIIKASEESRLYKGLKGFEYASYLIPAERISAKLNGTITTCIHLFRTPPLYDYANRKNQISRININVLSTPFQNGTREEIADATIVFYLTRRIIAIGNISNKLLYETIYEELGYENASKQLKLKLRKKIKEILTAWVNTEFGNIRITGHKEIKKKGVPYEIEIFYFISKE